MSIELKEAAQQVLKELGEARKIVRASSSRQLAKEWDRRATDALASLRAAIQQAEAKQPAAGEPDEWKLVPIVPTEKMLLAYTGGAVTNAGFSWCRHQWSAMLCNREPLPPTQRRACRMGCNGSRLQSMDFQKWGRLLLAVFGTRTHG